MIDAHQVADQLAAWYKGVAGERWREARLRPSRPLIDELSLPHGHLIVKVLDWGDSSRAGAFALDDNEARALERALKELERAARSEHRAELAEIREDLTYLRRRANPGRRKNRHYHVPERTVQLGTLLDLVVERGEERLTIEEWDGWIMATTEGAMDATPGRARLYLFAPEPGDGDGEASERGEETYDRWHDREPERVTVYDVPDTIGWVQGRVRRLGYRSDKWGSRGDAHDYDHDMGESGALPLLYTDSEFLDDARAAVIVGGDMQVTEAGID